jgi:hypothetical protein
VRRSPSLIQLILWGAMLVLLFYLRIAQNHSAPPPSNIGDQQGRVGA